MSRTNGDFHLVAASPCVDAGSTTNAPGADRDSVSRPLDGRNNGSAAHDIGAYEFVHPFADTDHDCMSDASEVIAGTDPVDARSTLQLVGAFDSLRHQTTLRWASALGRAYTLEFKPALGPTNAWEVLESSIEGTGAMLERQDTVQSTSRFYRLGAVRR